MIKFSLALLEKQPIALDGEESPELLGLAGPPGDACRAVSPVGYRLVARKVGGGALVEGDFRYRIAGGCGRCLAETERDLAGKLCLFYEHPAGEELDVTDDFREEALLALPMNLVCRDDCRGLCPRCGLDRNREECGCAAEAPPAESPWSALDDLDLKS